MLLSVVSDIHFGMDLVDGFLVNNLLVEYVPLIQVTLILQVR